MDGARIRELSCAAKIARVVLENCGPLSPSEIAEEAYISRERAESGVEDLREVGFVKPVCGMCDDREMVFALSGSAEPTA
jgi:DNA-binding transcriptional regulator GbsR (MarR family)